MIGRDYPEKHFAVDVMLGKLAKWLRVLGFDAPSMRLRDKSHIAGLVSAGFIPVTRNRGLQRLDGVLFVVGDRPLGQLKELLDALRIEAGEVRPLRRCLVCNSTLRAASREEVFGSVPDYIYEIHASFHRCPDCSRVYWPGSHKGRMIERIALITGWTELEKKEE